MRKKRTFHTNALFYFLNIKLKPKKNDHKIKFSTNENALQYLVPTVLTAKQSAMIIIIVQRCSTDLYYTPIVLCNDLRQKIMTKHKTIIGMMHAYSGIYTVPFLLTPQDFYLRQHK